MRNIDVLHRKCVSSVSVRRHLRSAGHGELDFPVSICPRTRDGRLPVPVLHPGTLCLAVSKTLILLCKPLNDIFRPSCFPHTSTLSAFEFSYKNVLHKFTVIKNGGEQCARKTDNWNEPVQVMWWHKVREYQATLVTRWRTSPRCTPVSVTAPRTKPVQATYRPKYIL